MDRIAILPLDYIFLVGFALFGDGEEVGVGGEGGRGRVGGPMMMLLGLRFVRLFKVYRLKMGVYVLEKAFGRFVVVVFFFLLLSVMIVIICNYYYHFRR